MSFTTKRTRSSVHHREKISSFSSVASSLAIICSLSLFIGYLWVESVGTIRVEEGTYNIGKGATLGELADTLDLDISSIRYKLWMRGFAPKTSLEVGAYSVGEGGETLEQFISETLTHPTHSDLTIRLLPGWNMYDMDEYFSSKNILKVGEFIETTIADFPILEKKYTFLEGAENLEGFLMPDTYRVRSEASAREIIEIMLSQFQKTIGTEYASMSKKDAYDTLKLASIVEREERNLEEQSTVAGILAKRKDEGMPIGADATVCYGYAKTQKQCTPSFIGSVIYDDNPYNTRSKLGYPPTPISSIKLDTWKNTVNRTSSPYYYYLHDNDGVIHYARTNDEHNVNKRNYLQ